MIEYPMPGQVPDLYKGFREELGNIEKRKQEKEARGLELASMIEMADQSTMFGGDYSEAQQMAQWMTDHIDDFTDSKEGIIEFRQMAQQLNGFIDASEAYKKQNFGTAQGGLAQGTWTGRSARKAAGIDPYEKDGFMDVRKNEDYEMTYMALNQERKLQVDENGRPRLSQQGRIENPFMPKLEELPFEGGFEWFESNSKGYSFPEGPKDAKNWIEAKADDPKLLRKIAKAWKEASGNPGDLESLMEEDKFMRAAKKQFTDDAMRSFHTHYAPPKPEVVKVDEDKTLFGRFKKLTAGQFDPGDMPGISTRGEEGVPPLGPGLGGMQSPVPALTTGFDSMYELAKPITGMAIGEDREVVGFNVDAFSNMYVVIREPGQIGGEDDTENLIKSDEPGMVLRTVKVEVGSPLSETLNAYIDSDIQQAIMNLSKRNIEGLPPVGLSEAEHAAAAAASIASGGDGSYDARDYLYNSGGIFNSAMAFR